MDAKPTSPRTVASTKQVALEQPPSNSPLLRASILKQTSLQCCDHVVIPVVRLHSDSSCRFPVHKLSLRDPMPAGAFSLSAADSLQYDQHDTGKTVLAHRGIMN